MRKGSLLTVKGSKVVCNNEADLSKNGLFVLDLDNQFDCPDFNVLPSQFIECNNLIEEYEVYKNYIVIGKVTDVCLI